MTARQSELRSTFASTVGGVMTEEVGAITGELEISTRLEDTGLGVAVRYAETDEWYRVDGSPVPIGDAASGDAASGDAASGDAASGGEEHLSLADLHRRVLEHLTTPGAVVGRNEEPTTLRGLSLA